MFMRIVIGILSDQSVSHVWFELFLWKASISTTQIKHEKHSLHSGFFTCTWLFWRRDLWTSLFGVSTFGYRGMNSSRWMFTIGGRWVGARVANQSFRNDGRSHWRLIIVFRLLNREKILYRWKAYIWIKICINVTAFLTILILFTRVLPFLAFNLIHHLSNHFAKHLINIPVCSNLHNFIRNWVEYPGQKASILMLWNSESKEIKNLYEATYT
jgi:hypothetical protein